MLPMTCFESTARSSLRCASVCAACENALIQPFQLYGPDVLRPNHHYATHTAECVRDYGPLHGFWTFLFERLNKVLKSYKTNNHSGGELETSFLREFFRTVATARNVCISHPHCRAYS